MITRLDHVHIAMPPGGEDLARKFYRDLLGLVEIEKPERLRARGGCWFEGRVAAGSAAEGSITEGPRVVLHLGIEEDFRPARKAHTAFTVSDLETLRRTFEDVGYAVIPDDAVPGVTRFFVSDPFGNRLEFIQDGQGFSQS